MADKVTVVVRHRVRGAGWQRTRLETELPENIDPENIDSFLAAQVHHAAATHTRLFLGERFDPLFVHAFLRQVLTGMAERATQGPNRRLAHRILRVLMLSDGQLLERHANGVRNENAR